MRTPSLGLVVEEVAEVGRQMGHPWAEEEVVEVEEGQRMLEGEVVVGVDQTRAGRRLVLVVEGWDAMRREGGAVHSGFWAEGVVERVWMLVVESEGSERAGLELAEEVERVRGPCLGCMVVLECARP